MKYAEERALLADEVCRQCFNTADDIDVLLALVEKMAALCPHDPPPALFIKTLKAVSAELRGTGEVMKAFGR